MINLIATFIIYGALVSQPIMSFDDRAECKLWRNALTMTLNERPVLLHCEQEI